ncbi:MAG: tRNA (adenine-N1)-methyltransferase [Sulfolobales archaeon]|nr:tRNA (adenine-N1)-methyltransferase [Sulfolobales archaeon]
MPIKEGDPVVIRIDPKRVYLVKALPQRTLHTDKGFIRLADVIGKEYGSSVQTSKGVKAEILRPTPFDIYFGLNRPSQVLYPKDIAYMIYSSGIRAGSKVLEAGTGSGFLALTLAYFLNNTGKVISYDVRKDMQEAARKNAETLGFTNIEFRLKDVREGFDEEEADAVFLDMPDPWNALRAAHNALKPSASLVVFVPTVNQVEKVALAMQANGFTDVHAEELILREYQVKENAVRPRNVGVVHTGYIVRARKSI